MNFYRVDNYRMLSTLVANSLKFFEPTLFFFSGCKSVPGGVESQASHPLQQHPPLPSRPGSNLEELPFSFPLSTKLVYSDYFCKKSKKVIVTGKTKTTKGWASEREDCRSVPVVDCRPRWSTVVVSHIHLFLFGLALPVDFF